MVIKYNPACLWVCVKNVKGEWLIVPLLLAQQSCLNRGLNRFVDFAEFGQDTLAHAFKSDYGNYSDGFSFGIDAQR